LQQAATAETLWILGDLFEAWLGDDIGDPACAPVVDALARLSDTGTALHLLHGNRDFLLGEAFATKTGATLHRDDEVIVELSGEATLLLHGDTLCTGDTDYQSLRVMLRNPAWQRDFLAGTPAKRLDAARALRERSREATAGKSGGIMDVDPDAVIAAFERSQCRTMIHGHTHRPADHSTPAGRRLVLGDWHDDHAEIIRHEDSRFFLETWR